MCNGLCSRRSACNRARRRKQGLFLTADDAEHLLKTLEQLGAWDAHDLALVILRTGISYGDALSLRWEDIDLNHVGIRLRRRRCEPLRLVSREIINLLLSRSDNLNGPFNLRDCKNMKKDRLFRALWTACDRAGLPQLNFRSLRSSFSSLYLPGDPYAALSCSLTDKANADLRGVTTASS